MCSLVLGEGDSIVDEHSREKIRLREGKTKQKQKNKTNSNKAFWELKMCFEN